MTTIVYVKCPYCGFNNREQVRFSNSRLRQVLTCASEDGGCDSDFVLRVTFSAQVEALEIAGEHPKTKNAEGDGV